MDGLGKATGIVAIVAGVLEGAFALFAVLGAILGAFIADGALPTQRGDADPAAMGGLILALYGAIFLFNAIGAVLHLQAGVQLLRNKPNRTFLWVAAAGSIFPAGTVYCSLTALPVAILLLIWLLKDIPDPVP